MDTIYLFFHNLILLSADASPWLLLGLLIAGLMKAWVPSQILSQHLGKGSQSIIKAALIGAPLPLCSCGVIPVAKELHKSGASDAATASFLVATPETGVDSISISYAMLGPVFAIYRPITAILSAIFTGLLVAPLKGQSSIKNSNRTNESSCCATKQTSSAQVTSCCEPVKVEKKSCCTPVKVEKTSCCTPAVSKETCCSKSNSPKKNPSKTLMGIRYACTQLVDDIIVWLFIGLLFATLVKTFIPSEFLLSYGSGLPAMLMMILISIPMYICATASTPIAAGFILAGLSPGTALVFMMAGPATNISTLGVVKQSMGNAVLVRYLLGITSSAIGFGLLLDWALQYFHFNIVEQMQHSHSLLPLEIGIACSLFLVVLAIKPLRKCFI